MELPYSKMGKYCGDFIKAQLEEAVRLGLVVDDASWKSENHGNWEGGRLGAEATIHGKKVELVAAWDKRGDPFAMVLIRSLGCSSVLRRRDLHKRGKITDCFRDKLADYILLGEAGL